MELLPEILAALATLAAAAAVAAAVLAGVELYQRFTRHYLATLGVDQGAAAAGPAPPEAALAGSLLALRKTGIAFLAGLNQRWVPRPWLDGMQARLRKAGHPGEFQPAEMVALVELSAFTFLLGGVALALWLDLSWPVTCPLAALFGGAWPLLWLGDKVRARHHAITRALPYNLDLLTLSVEAGLDFAAAIAKVVEKGRKGPLADELGLMLRELKLGKTREEALRNLAARVELATLTSLVNALIQADKMGTPLGKILRVLSTQMRVDRTLRAEKLANEAPVKLLFPLIAFIFPTIFIMLFGPIAWSVFRGGQ